MMDPATIEPTASDAGMDRPPYRHEVLRQQILERIRLGELRPGDRLPTFADMYRRYGATQATVSRAYTALEQAGVVQRRPGSGVYVNEPSAAGRTGRVGLLGWGLSYCSHKLYWATLLDGVRAGLREAGLQVPLLDTNTPMHACRDVDGLLVIPTESAPAVPADLPCVAMLSRSAGAASVTLDDYAGIRAATEHLLALGHKRIGLASFGRDKTDASYNSIVEHRELAYRDALRNAGIEPDASWVRRFFANPNATSTQRQDLTERARQRMAEWLGDSSPHGWDALGLTAIVAFNDDFAVGIIQALRAFGRDVPADISVTGFDGLDSNRFFQPRLTTIEAPLDRLGRVAGERLAQRIHAPHKPAQDTALAVQLRRGDSTAPPPGTGTSPGANQHQQPDSDHTPIPEHHF